MVEMKDSWFRSKKKQLHVQHHRERFKTRIMMPVWKLTVEIISINKLMRRQVCQRTTHCSKTTHLDQEFRCTGRSAWCSNYQVVQSWMHGSTAGQPGPRIHLTSMDMPPELWLFSPSTSFANLQPLLQLWRKGKGNNAACEAQYIFSMIAKMLLIQSHVCCQTESSTL